MLRDFNTKNRYWTQFDWLQCMSVVSLDLLGCCGVSLHLLFAERELDISGCLGVPLHLPSVARGICLPEFNESGFSWL